MTGVAGLVVLFWLSASDAAVAQSPQEPQAGAERSPDTDVPEKPIPLRQVPLNILHDQKPIWTFPGRMVQGQHWKPTLAVVLGTVGLVALDPHSESYFYTHSGFRSYSTGPLRGRNTTLAITLTPAVFYVTGLATHGRHAQNTALLAAEALADSQLVTFAIKHATGRLFPSAIPPHSGLGDTWFQYKGSFTNGGSFPSGHSASAFAVASVISHRYREHRWVPWVAYGAAAALALTRIPDLAHFPSDVFFGSAVGYGIGGLVAQRH